MLCMCMHFFFYLYRQERKQYYHHREKSRAHPEKYIRAKKEQSKTNVPLYRLRMHLSGAIIHTRSPHGKIIYAFYDIMQWPNDSNLILQVLNNILHDFKAKLPNILYLQLDNCFRENKNRCVLGYCALLVQRKVFKKVTFAACLHFNAPILMFAFSLTVQNLRQSSSLHNIS